MKVFYTNSSLAGCYYVRCLLPLRAGGWDGDRTSIHSHAIADNMKAKAVLDADIIVFHRPNDERSLETAKLLRSQGKKIVMDNDDTYKQLEGRVMSKLLEKIDSDLDKFVLYADLITCSTEFLAREYRKLNKNVVVLPNCIAPDDWPEPLKNDTKKVRIGLIGSVGINGDVDSFMPTLKELTKRDDVQIVLMSLPIRDDSTKEHVQKLYKEDYAMWDAIPNIEWHPFVNQEDYIDALNELKLDIMVIPRKDDYFNRCKSNLKFLEASMLEIPVIAQGFEDGLSPYQGEKDSKYMRIVMGDAWMEALEPLIQDSAAREMMGKVAHDYVLDAYNIEDKVYLWERAYGKLV